MTLPIELVGRGLPNLAGDRERTATAGTRVPQTSPNVRATPGAHTAVMEDGPAASGAPLARPNLHAGGHEIRSLAQPRGESDREKRLDLIDDLNHGRLDVKDES